MTGETAPQMGFRAQMRELLSQEPVSIVPVTERNLLRFDKTLTNVSQKSEKAGMFPVTGKPDETNEEWASNVKALWLIGQKEADFSEPSNVAGYVNVYAPEHEKEINEWLLAKGKHTYDSGSLVEIASYVHDGPQTEQIQHSADRQALARVFMDDAFKDVRAVTSWVTNTPENKLDSKDYTAMKKLGGWPIGSTRYNQSESVDSTCFLITRRAFLDSVTGGK